jgi:hypothetical protein
MEPNVSDLQDALQNRGLLGYRRVRADSGPSASNFVTHLPVPEDRGQARVVGRQSPALRSRYQWINLHADFGHPTAALKLLDQLDVISRRVVITHAVYFASLGNADGLALQPIAAAERFWTSGREQKHFREANSSGKA